MTLTASYVKLKVQFITKIGTSTKIQETQGAAIFYANKAIFTE
jgi:hypothetical protein